VTERLSDVMARIGSVRQLSSVIGAMRGIAAARAREARERAEGVRAYARTVGAARGRTRGKQPSRDLDGRRAYSQIVRVQRRHIQGVQLLIERDLAPPPAHPLRDLIIGPAIVIDGTFEQELCLALRRHPAQGLKLMFRQNIGRGRFRFPVQAQ